eukprot:5511002-Alexandrium_andersonii.AAC.1
MQTHHKQSTSTTLTATLKSTDATPKQADLTGAGARSRSQASNRKAQPLHSHSASKEQSQRCHTTGACGAWAPACT